MCLLVKFSFNQSLQCSTICYRRSQSFDWTLYTFNIMLLLYVQYLLFIILGGYNRRMSGDGSAREEYRKIYTYTSELRKFENTI